MSQVSVVQYNNNNNATVAAQKVNILQQNTSTNHASSIISDRHIIVLRKPPTILPQPNKDYPKDDILITNPGRKGIKKPGKEPKTSPPPISVARRNARERNRVKQVNNGFANLRQHIPNFIAQAFESSNGRGNKKLSKVETLRMAVEYIRSLEDVLALDGYTLPKEEPRTSSDSSSLYQNENNGTSSDMGYSFVMSPSDDDDDFSSVNTASPQQYIRINTANNTFEIVPTLYGDNSENLDPMNVDGNNHHQLNLLDSELDLNSQDLTYLQVNTLQGTTNDSLSPGMYSEDSLSPNNENNCTKLSECNLPQNCFIPVFTTGRLGDNFNVEIKEELPVISIKEGEQHEHIDEITNWWEQNAPQNNS